LVDKHQTCRADMVRLLDRMVRQYKFNKTQTRKLIHIIGEMCLELAPEGFEDLKDIYNFHHPDQDFDTVNEEADDLTAAMMKDLVSEMFGIDLDDDVDLDTPEKFQAHLAQKMAERAAEAERLASETKTRAAEKPKTDRQLKAEAKKAAQEEKRKEEEKKISKTVREVYMDLVKAFHPDREPDAEEKIRKTAILQRVTAAYEANDLLALLQLQLELERINEEHLDSLADDKLRYFNKNLKSQLAELTEELWNIESDLARMSQKSPFDFFNPQLIEWEFEKSLKELKKHIKNIKQDLEQLRDPEVLKTWLQDYRI
jgi:hypothetical protein